VTKKKRETVNQGGKNKATFHNGAKNQPKKKGANKRTDERKGRGEGGTNTPPITQKSRTRGRKPVQKTKGSRKWRKNYIKNQGSKHDRKKFRVKNSNDSATKKTQWTSGIVRERIEVNRKKIARKKKNQKPDA